MEKFAPYSGPVNYTNTRLHSLTPPITNLLFGVPFFKKKKKVVPTTTQ